MIDAEGFRLNVGIVLAGPAGHVFWAKRVGQNAWQFPQGGMQDGETPLQAMYRELMEEIGLGQQDVEVIAESEDWYHYRLPKNLIRHRQKPLCIGQKQKWFLLKLTSHERKIRLQQEFEIPEFDSWRWISYWQPADEVVYFKKAVYKRMLKEFSAHL